MRADGRSLCLVYTDNLFVAESSFRQALPVTIAEGEMRSAINRGVIGEKKRWMPLLLDELLARKSSGAKHSNGK